MADIIDGFHYWNFDSIQEFEGYALKEIDKVCRNNNIHYYLAYGSLLGAKRHGGSIPWDMDADIYMPQQEILRFVKVAREQLPDDLWVNFYDINPDYIYTYPQIGKKGFSTDGMHVDVYQLYGLPRGERKAKRHMMKIEWQRVFFRAKKNIWESRIPKIEKMRHSRIYRFILKLYTRFFDCSKFTGKVEKLGSKYDLFKDCDKVYDGMRVFSAEWFKEGIDVLYDNYPLKAPDGAEKYLTKRYGDYMSLPQERSYQYIKYSMVNDEIPNRRVAYINDFVDMTEEKFKRLEELYWVSGSIIAVVNLSNVAEDKRSKSISIAKSIKYFDKVFVNEKGLSEEEKILEMISPTLIERV